MSSWEKAEIKPYRELLKQLKELRELVAGERDKLANELEEIDGRPVGENQQEAADLSG